MENESSSVFKANYKVDGNKISFSNIKETDIDAVSSETHKLLPDETDTVVYNSSEDTLEIQYTGSKDHQMITQLTLSRQKN